MNINKCIITQAKDQSSRLKDWILYHKEQGFDTIIYFDDYSEDDSIKVLEQISVKYNVNIIVNYSDGFGNKKSQQDMANSDSYAGDSSVCDRIIRSFNKGLQIVKAINPDAICAFIDVDEFIVSNDNVSMVIDGLFETKNQIYVHSFDVSDEFETGDWYTLNENTSKRWCYESRKKSVFGFRGKSICIASSLDYIPEGSNYVHVLKPEYNSISHLYNQELVDNISIDDYNKLRIHHFRKPKQNVDIDYVTDNTLIEKINKIKEKYEI